MSDTSCKKLQFLSDKMSDKWEDTALALLQQGFVRQLLKNELNSMPYFPRIEEMDRLLGFEPTTSAQELSFKSGSCS
jgi:hypothetical protein